MERSTALEAADRASEAESGPLVSDNAALRPEPFLVSTGPRSPTEDAYSPFTSVAQYDGRVLDVTVATLLLLLVLPLMALCAASVLLTGRGPILFRHPRIGRNGVVFECLKFRTMAWPLVIGVIEANAPRVTRTDDNSAAARLTLVYYGWRLFADNPLGYGFSFAPMTLWTSYWPDLYMAPSVMNRPPNQRSILREKYFIRSFADILTI